MRAEQVVKEIPKVINKQICLQKMPVALKWISFSRVYNRKFSCSLIHQSDWSTNIKTAKLMSVASLVIYEVLLKSVPMRNTVRPSGGSMILQTKWGGECFIQMDLSWKWTEKIGARWGCVLVMNPSIFCELLTKSIQRMLMHKVEDSSYSIG